MGKPHPDIFGISAMALAAMCKVDISTARRWKRGAMCPPESALMIVRRDLRCFSEFWSGWTINGEDLVSPDGWCVNRNDALAVQLSQAQISALRYELAKAKAAQYDGVEDQPGPDEIVPIIKTG